MTEPRKIIEIQDLKVWFPIKRGVLNRTQGHVKAVDGVSLDIAKGETLGLVGESGCGKTTLGRALLGLEKSREGVIRFNGDSLESIMKEDSWRKKVQIVFQDPYASLNPRMTVMDILTEGMIQHGILKNGKENAARELLQEVGMDPDSIFRYPHEFSGGQRQRICIARALSLKPEFIVCDEAVSALDVSVQAQVIKLLMNLRESYGLAYMFISHDLAVVRHIAHRTAVMYLGAIVETGPTDQVIGAPLHPYTKALISAVPRPGKKKAERIILSGDPPSPAAPPPGCRFHTRCPQAMEICKTKTPQPSIQGDTTVSCHLYG